MAIAHQAYGQHPPGEGAEGHVVCGAGKRMIRVPFSSILSLHIMEPDPGRPPTGRPRSSSDQHGSAVPHAPAPPIQVVGFHVEGVAASPAPAGQSLLTSGNGGGGGGGGGGLVSSSPQPVMVPPTFQVRREEG